MKKLLFLLVLTCCLTAGAQKKVIDSKTTYAKEVLQPYVDRGELPGAISIFYNNGVQETCCIGYANVEQKRPIKLDNVFMQCSQTKGFCGVTIAKLVEEGKLSLDDPVSKYLPEFKELWVQDSDKDGIKTLHKAKNVLTVRMVLNHTGGFPFECSAKRNDVRGGGWSGGAPLRQVASIAAASPISFEPGTRDQYSNTGIEMYDTHKDAPATYRLENGWEQRPYNDGHVFASAGAGLWTTANDQLKFYKMLMNLGVGDNGVRILKEETVKSILAVTTRPDNLGGYSLGLNAPKKDGENEWFGHGGAWGTNCMVNWHKKQLKLWVVQLNGGQPWNNAMNEAANKFFSQTIDTSGIDAYTGRTK